MSFIDAHVHVWTDDFARYPLAPGYRVEDMKPPTFTRIAPWTVLSA